MYQNYPNPFNPSTTIGFDVAQNTFTTLKVYNLLGQEVATLVNEDLLPGAYSVMWDASSMPSGVYFYRMTAGGGFSDVKKLLVLR